MLFRSDEQSKNQLEGNGDEGITEGDDERGQRFLVGENVDVVHQAVLGNAVKEVHIRKAVEQGSGKRIQLEHHKTNDPGNQYGDKDIQVNKIYAEGNFGDSMLKLGRYGEFSSYGRIIDTEISGAEYTFEAGDLSEIGRAHV